MSGKTTRKVTVDKSRRLSAEGPPLVEQSSSIKKRSVFDRLGTAGSSYDPPEKCRTFMREGECPFGNKCKFSHDIGLDVKRARKGEKVYKDSGDTSFESYQDAEKIPDKKKDRRKFMDTERLKIEFKKDNVLKKKQTIAELYEEEIPSKKNKKEKKERFELSSSLPKSKKSLNDEGTIEKEIHVRNVQIKDGKHKKTKHEGKFLDRYDEVQDSPPSKKHKKKKYQDNEEEEASYKEKAEVATSKKKKKKKDKVKYSSTSDDDVEDDHNRKKKSKKEKFKGYESEDSLPGSERRKAKHHEYEEIEYEEVKRKKKKKKDKYDSGNDEVLAREESYKKDYEEEKPKKNKKNTDMYVHTSKSSQYEDDQQKKKKAKSMHQNSPKSEKAKDRSKRSSSWSFSSESSVEEANGEDVDRRMKKKNKQKGSHVEDKKDRDKKQSKLEDTKASHRRHLESSKDVLIDKKREQQGGSYAREHYSKQHFTSKNPEPSYDSWDRDHASSYDDRQHTKQYESASSFGRGRGQSLYKDRHDAHSKGGDDRQQYRQYQDQLYMPEQGKYRDRGGRDAHGYTANRRGGYEEESFQSGRSREFFQGSLGYQHEYSQEEKARYRHQSNYPAGKDHDDSVDRDQKRSSRRSSKERKNRDSKSPKPKRRNFSPKDAGYGNDDERMKTKKRKRDDVSAENDPSAERKKKKSKIDAKSDSEAEYDVEEKSDRGRKDPERGRKHFSRGHRDSESNYRKEDITEDKKERRSDKESRERDHRPKGITSSEKPRKDKGSSRTEKRGGSHSQDEGQGNKVEDKRVKALRSSHGRNSPSDRSDNDSSVKSHKKGSGGKGPVIGPDGNELSLDDVYEKISDDELDFFDEENSKSQKPVSLEDMDWSALAAIAPPSKIDKSESEERETPRNKHTAVNVLKKIGFSSNLLSKETLNKIKEKCTEESKKINPGGEIFDFSDFAGTGSFVLSKIRNKDHRKNLIKDLMKEGTVLSMRKDISIRKELRLPSNKVSLLSLNRFNSNSMQFLE